MTEGNSRQVIFQNYANEMKAYMELTELYEMSLHCVCTEQGLPYRTSETTIYENKFIITFINFAFLGLQKKLFARLNRLQNRLK